MVAINVVKRIHFLLRRHTPPHNELQLEKQQAMFWPPNHNLSFPYILYSRHGDMKLLETVNDKLNNRPLCSESDQLPSRRESDRTRTRVSVKTPQEVKHGATVLA